MEDHEQRWFSPREISSASSDGATTTAAGKGTKRPRKTSPQNDGSGPPVRIKLDAGLESHPQENVQQNSTPAAASANNSSTPSPSTSKTTPNRPAPISNFFQFSSAPLPNVVPTLVDIKEREQGLGAPPPMMPKVAHYNAHDEKDEVRYVEEHQAQANRIIQGHKQESSDSEEETNTNGYYAPEHSSRYFQNEATVFRTYDFVNRKIDTSRLAVASAKEKILNAIENHRVVIVDGFTGCGKTTQVPQFILDQYYQNRKVPNIVVTQPRKIAAISVAKRVCAERGWPLGKVVGYQVGMESKKDKDDTLITYMTTGVLLQKLIGCRRFNHLTHIIIDEVHERDLESDLLLLVIKKILQDDIEGKQRHVKFVLMSATLNAKKFSKYFPTQTGESDVSECPVVKIPHTFRHRVDELFLENILQNNKEMYDVIENSLDIDKASIPEEVYTVAVDCIVGLDEIDRKMSTDPRVRSAKANSPIQKRGSVLIFLPGMEEINRLFRSLHAKNKIALDEACQNDPNFKESDFYKWDVVPLHSTITNDEQQRVFQSQIDYHRKIILSTNIAESSVTVPDVMYVIDFCLTKSLCIDPFTNFTTLRMVWASVSQCIQRKGRTGRVGDGKVYRLIPKSFFSQLPQDTKPEMLRANLETVVLQLKKLNMGDPKELLAMALDPPVISGIERAVANLKELGALTICRTRNGRPQYDTCDGDLTFLGAVMTDLPIPQQCTRLIMLGHCFGVMKEAIIIAAALSVKNPFSTPFVRSLEAYLSRLNWAKNSCSDLFALYHVYKHWLKQFAEPGDFQGSRSQYNERQWARGAFVQLSVLREIKSTVELIEERLVRHSLILNPLSADTSPSNDLPKEASLMLKLAIAGAFYPNFFHRRRPDVKTYERDKSREICGLDLFNTVYFKGFPPGHNGKVYAKPVSDHLSFGLNVPSIKFDGQKVFATFDNRGEKIGPISKGVYRAVKQRQLRDVLEFPLTTRDVERKVIEDWGKKIEIRRFTRCPNQIELPRVDTPRIYVRVTHVENPGQFWINYASQTKDLDEMVSRINDELVHISMPSARIVPNALCLAPYQDTYYRAKIVLVAPRPLDDSLVYFVDYGNSCWVKNSVLEDFSPSMIEKEYHLVPCMGVECRLSNIKPATIHGAGWHEKSKLEFEIFAQNAPFVCMDVYSVTKSIIAGKLVGHDERSVRVEQSLNEKLVCLGYAEFCDEATYSEFNHRARTRVHLQDAEEKKAHNKEQIGKQLDYDFVITDFSRENCVKQTLKGAWSPLELDFQSLCHSSNTKQVKVDTNSVNSVVLDTEPTAPISRLMVSAHVGIQDRSGSVVARDTTIMPSVPGLLPLLSMLFAPKIELRADIRQTRYTGVLCGLGTVPGEPDLPIYPDHDVEIVFDTLFDDEDIDSINKIRFMMNVILRNGSSEEEVAPYKNSLSKDLASLLQRQRKGADEEVWPQEEYVWNRIDEASLRPPNRGSFIYEFRDIFCPHNKVLLNLDNDNNWAWEFAV